MELYNPPTSIWRLIKQHVPPEELVLVRNCIGESKLDYCSDLENELDVLLEIWREIRDEGSAPSPMTPESCSSVPEPANLRNMLTKEIELLLESLREKQNKNFSPRGSDRSIINYALVKNKEKISTSRPVTPIERPSTPMMTNSREIKENVLNDTSMRYVAKDINANNIDRVVTVLREALDEQCDTLLHDIEFIQSCIEDENDLCVRNLPEKEPSINELRNECKKLEDELLKDSVFERKVNKTFPCVTVQNISKRPNTAPVINNQILITHNSIKNTMKPRKQLPTALPSKPQCNITPGSNNGSTKMTRIIEVKSIIAPGNLIPRPPSALKPVCVSRQSTHRIRHCDG